LREAWESKQWVFPRGEKLCGNTLDLAREGPG
jgi:hypothetical protein